MENHNRKTQRGLSRRSFLARTCAAALSASSICPAARAVPRYNDAVRVGLIGCGGMGSRHLEALVTNPECRVVAVCDVAESRYKKAVQTVENAYGSPPEGYQDFRYLLDNPEVDAAFIATPDHWHALLTILACQAGKDVYVEKPLCTTVSEGRAMVRAARRYNRVVQVGTQQRSMPVFQRAIALVQSGYLGKITSATAWVGVNGWGVGENPEPPPPGLNWDLWLGPAPWVPFSKERFYGFMGWWDYARGGQLTNWGIHLMDVVQWGIGREAPLTITALGGSFRQGAGADNYETIEAVFEYPGCLVTWEQRHSNSYEGKGYGVKFQGTEGALWVDRNTFVVKPEALGFPEYIGEPERSWAYPPHHNNFFHCVRTRQKPVADVEQGLRSTSTVLLAGIALRLGRTLQWDAQHEHFVNDDAANAYLRRAYRPPWHYEGLGENL